MRQRDGVIFEAFITNVVRTLSASTYEADVVISPFENKVWGVNESLNQKLTMTYSES